MNKIGRILKWLQGNIKLCQSNAVFCWWVLVVEAVLRLEIAVDRVVELKEIG
jgi:hypothetical protein